MNRDKSNVAVSPFGAVLSALEYKHQETTKYKETGYKELFQRDILKGGSLT